MKNPFKVISIGLIPNFTGRDVRNAWRLLRGSLDSRGSGEKLKNELSSYFGKEVLLTESGRNALFLLLKAWGVGKGDEVIMQALTCSVVPMVIKNLGAKVIYVDIDLENNLDLGELESKINKKTKVVIVQHSFGKAVEMDKVMEICSRNKIIVVEDLAHGLGNKYKGKLLGTWGDAAILSFGRDKVISGVWGGAVVTGESEKVAGMESIESMWPKRDRRWVRKQLMYVVWTKLIIETYSFLNLGKILHWFLRRSGVLSEVISVQEKRGEMDERYGNLPDELCWLALDQFRSLDRLLEHRKKLAKFYSEELGEKYDDKCTYLRYSLRVFGAGVLRQQAAEKGVFLGDWYDQVIAPKSVDVHSFDYVDGSCKKAEVAAAEMVNLPTNPNIDDNDVLKVVGIIKKWNSKR